MRLVVKIGGAQLQQPESLAEFATSVAEAVHCGGHQIVVVHGGGPQMREWSQAIGIEDRYHNGLRITDADTAELALGVLGGVVNRKVVRHLGAAGTQAVGLTGADGELFEAEPVDAGDTALGFVGQIASVNPTLVLELWQRQIVPVIAPIAPRTGDQPSEPFYNINADTAAAALATVLAADALLLLTDIEAVQDQHGAPKHELSIDDALALTSAGAISGGMTPKVQAALSCLPNAYPDLIRIAYGRGPDAIQSALQPDVGTTFVRTSAPCR